MDNNTEKPTVNNGKRRFSMKNEYAKIGLMFFIVVAGSILFYFSFFKDHTLFGFFKSIWSCLMPFTVGAVLAYLLKPICVVFEKWTAKWFSNMKNRNGAKKLSQNLSIFFAVIIFLAFMYVIFATVIPQVIDSIKVLVEAIPDAYSDVMDWLVGISKGTVFEDTVTQFSDDTLKNVQKIVTQLFGDGTSDGMITDKVISGVTVGVKGVLAFLKNLLIGLVACVYILAQRKKLAAQGKMIIYSVFKKKWADRIMEEICYVDKMFSGFINGKIIDSIIIGIITFIVTTIFKIPYAMLISVIVGVTNVIPFFGPWIGAVPCALIAFMVSPVKCLYFIIMIIAIQQFDGNILGPKILGNTTGLSSFWVLFSIIFFGGLFGFAGMLVGVPLFAVIYDLIERGVKRGLKNKGKYELYEQYDIEQHEEERLKEEAKEKKDPINRIRRLISRHRK